MNRQTLKITLPLALLGIGFSSPLLAKEFSYNYAELGVADVEVDDNDGDYIYGGGSLSLNSDVFIRGSLGSLDFEPGEADVISLGVVTPCRFPSAVIWCWRWTTAILIPIAGAVIAIR